jgi:hypothetical protein
VLQVKQVIAGGFLALCGAIINAAIIIAAGAYSTALNSWVGFKFWYAIFSRDISQGMGLGLLFIISSIFLLTGIVIMVKGLVSGVNQEKA